MEKDCVGIEKCSQEAYCPFPACLDMHFKPVVEDHDLAYHGDCTACSSGELSNIGLCLSCQNLRLRHLLLCTDMRKWCFIPFGKIREIIGRTDCRLCSLVSSITRRFWRVTGSTVGRGQDEICTLATCYYDEFPDTALLLRIVVPPAPGEMDWEIIGYMHIQLEDLHLQSFPAVPAETTIDRCLRYSHRKFYAIHNRSSDGDRLFRPTPLVSAEVDWDRVDKWLDLCTREHDCVPTKPQDFPSLRVVDVQKRCITAAPPNCQYIVLSYVWGNPDMPKLRATLGNIDELEEPNGLSSDKLECTIDDAIRVCARLGVRYLWVDRLCIVQDDVHSIKGSIDSMCDIYSSAYLMIVAASGDNADSGLAGAYHKSRPQPQTSRIIQKMEITELMPNFDYSVMCALWNMRGWTYQERMLAPRSLIFTLDQVFFSCEELLCFEDACVGNMGEIIATEWFPYWRPRAIHGPPDPFDEYERRLKEYSIRRLTLPSDAVNAFLGINHAIFNGRQKSFLCGLPEHYFDRAMLWDPSTGYKHRTGASFPSWSWASHDGETDHFVYGLICGSLVDWYIYDNHHEWSRVRSSAALSEAKSDGVEIRPQFHRALNAITSAFPDQTPIRYIDTAPGESASPSGSTWGNGRLLCRTQAAHFALRDYSALNDRKGLYFMGWLSSNVTQLTIINHNGDHAGLIEMNKEWIAVNLSPLFTGTETLFEFIALSVIHPKVHFTLNRYQLEHNLVSNFHIPPELIWPYFRPMREAEDGESVEDSQVDSAEGSSNGGTEDTPDGEEASEDETLDQDSSQACGESSDGRDPSDVSDLGLVVMLIAWRGQIAHRLGIGKVLLHRWLDAQPTWKTIALA